ncbi:quinon protein alcohol dehydrogenase-like superfamily, partial [Baffinella frigidus]
MSDGLVIVGTEDGTVRFVDPATGQVRRCIQAHGRAVISVALSHDGSYAASAGDQQSAVLWDTTTGERILALQGHDGGGGCICCTDEDGACAELHPQCCCTGHAARVRAIALSRDGRRAVTGDARGAVLVWSFDTRAEDAVARVVHRMQGAHAEEETQRVALRVGCKEHTQQRRLVNARVTGHADAEANCEKKEQEPDCKEQKQEQKGVSFSAETAELRAHSA